MKTSTNFMYGWKRLQVTANRNNKSLYRFSRKKEEK